ncbi:MAG: PSD1 and planctomycete cytochrome C domain-containing protein [Bryobacteraceae bacterium]
MRIRITAAMLLAAAAWAEEPVRFSREILPILSDRCLSCHGQDERGRMAGLRLDRREDATAPQKTGAAIVPGNPAESRMMARIAPADPKRLMPPPYSHKKPLDEKQVALIRTWIAQGADWGRHWSFEPPVRPAVGEGHPVDVLVRRRLSHDKLALSPEAPRLSLARRVSFDLTGLPPSPEILAAFRNDSSPGAYERLVDSLLGSERFGERMAMWWLDAARYADTDGFQADETRTNWPWRDWVVDAFNRNMPFDRFTIEQFAGDLLPNATPEQIIATAFHRNHMTNGEGGRDPEESRIDYVIDRVNTTGTVWLGLTLGCTQCHSHKFDPISHRDYYSLAAFFQSVDEDGRAGKRAKPYFKYESPYAARAIAEAAALLEERKRGEAAVRSASGQPSAIWLAAREKEIGPGYKAWRPLTGTTLESVEGTKLVHEPAGVIAATGPNPKQDDYRVAAPVRGSVTGIKLEVFPHASHSEGRLSRGASGEFLLTDVKVQVRRQGDSQVRDIKVAGAVADYSADKKANGNYGDVKDTLDDDPRNGWTTKGSDPRATHTAVFALAEPLMLAAGEQLVFEMRHRSTAGDANIGRFRVSVTDQPGPAVESLETAPLEQLARAGGADRIGGAVRQLLLAQFLTGHPPYVAAKQALDRAQNQFDLVKDSASVNVMVLAERPEPRESHVLLRGIWDKKGETVTPAVLPSIAPMPPGAPANRLGLAQWLVSRGNPLTARVVVNQLWQLLFGAGLVRTTEDFGLQGEQPLHGELLDWLAVEFMESGWDLKHMLRLMVSSAVYKQQSVVSAEMLARDPENRLLARGARYRLPSWMLRDAALAYAGLLNPAIGGPPMRPYQPDGVWEELFMGRFQYLPSEGPAQYRRTLYAFWRRSIAPVFLFDTAQRRSCEVRVSRTNTPLQALTLMNDETYLEASRVIGEKAMGRGGDRVAAIFERILGRAPSEPELEVVSREYERALAFYRSDPGEAAKFLAVGQQKNAPRDPELAASMFAASLILNLDEAITHE